MKKAQFFHPPKKKLHLPFEAYGLALTFGIFEIGCLQNPRKKQKQLARERETFQHYCAKTFNQHPKCYKAIVSLKEPDLDSERRLKCDYYIHYKGVPENSFKYLAKKQRILESSNLKPKEIKIARNILDTNSLWKLYQFLQDPQESGRVRGLLLELLVQKDLKRTAPPGVNLMYNGTIRDLRPKETNYTSAELDVVSAFYGDKPMFTHIDRLNKSSYLEVITQD